MCSGAVITYFIPTNLFIVALAFAISGFFKGKIIPFVCVSAIWFFITVMPGDTCVFISYLFALGIVGLIYILIKFFKTLNNDYVEPVQKRHNNNIQRYRRYVINCDKKGKQPLSYKQWKFAYGDTKK